MLTNLPVELSQILYYYLKYEDIKNIENIFNIKIDWEDIAINNYRKLYPFMKTFINELLNWEYLIQRLSGDTPCEWRI
jgi:hypothetical protein